MARWTRVINFLRAAMASSIALTAAGVTRVEAQSASANAYRQAKQAGSIAALEKFIEAYPLSPEANAAFRDIVLLTRRSTLVDGAPAGLAPSAPAAAATRGIEAY